MTLAAGIAVLGVEPGLAAGTTRTKADGPTVRPSAPSESASRGTLCPTDFPFRFGWSGPLGVAIPDNAPEGVFVGSVPLPDEGLLIDDVVVDVNLAHTFAGDVLLGIWYDLDNDSFGDIGPVMLMCTPGIVGCAFEDCCGCDGDLNGEYRFSDSGSGVLGEVECTPELAPGCYQPDSDGGSLQIFDGAPDGGQWLLYAWDYEAQDTGTVSDFAVSSRLGCGHPILNVPADYATVQEAVDAACYGDTVRIAPGSYGDVIADFGSPSKAVVITGTDPAMRPTLGTVELRNAGRGSALRDLVASSVTLEGDAPFDVVNVQTAGDLIVDGRADWVTIMDCTVGGQLHCGYYKGLVQNCSAGWIDVFEQEVGHVEGCFAHGIQVDCRNNGGAIVRSNTVIGNGTLETLVTVRDYDQPVSIGRNVVVGQAGGTDTGVDLDPTAAATADLDCNDVWRCATRWSGVPDPTGLDGNISVDPLFCDESVGDYTLTSGSPCAPGQHPDGADCGTIGRFSVGCETSAIVNLPLASGLRVSAAPNPSQGQVTFAISGAVGEARLHIYDASGRSVRTLLVPTSNGAGEASWDQRDDAGHPAAAGVYFYELSTQGGDATKRLIVLR